VDHCVGSGGNSTESPAAEFTPEGYSADAASLERLAAELFAFEYSGLTLDRHETKPFEPVTVSLKVRNTGAVEGTEVVQLYVRDIHASMTRPVKELQGFARVSLLPGEEKEVAFTLHPSQTAFLDEDMRWLIERGDFEVQIGSSSEDIRLRDTFRVTESAHLAGKTRAFYALGRISPV